ncbi:MAG: glycosyltransferase family 4 protein [Pseudomonadales bacterium]
MTDHAGPASAAGTSPTLLQVCPNDLPPFRAICAYHEAAARALGWRATTVFLAPAAAEPMAAACYLDLADLHRTGAMAAALRLSLAGLPLEPRGTLVLCHRYRALRALRASGLRARRCVAVAHEFGFLDRWQRRLRERLRSRDSTLFAGVSDPVRDELRRTVAGAITLPNGIDLAAADAARLDRPAARRALAVAADEFVIGVVGRLHWKKGPELALRGFALAAPELPDARLLFIGSGELAAGLEREARSLSVSFTGFVADAPRCFAALDLLLLPSTTREAFGMVALEAMAAGVPVLSGPAPGPRYVLGDTARIFEPATPEALAAALVAMRREAAGGALSHRASAGRRRAEQMFSVGAGAVRLQRLYDGIEVTPQ